MYRFNSSRLRATVIIRWIAYLCILVLATGCKHAYLPESRACILIENVNVVDVENELILPFQNIVISEGIIDSIDNHKVSKAPSCDQVIDATGKYAVPGLWDMHVHALWDLDVAEAFLPLFVRNGVTTIRDMGGDIDVLREIRKRYSEQSILSPRIFAAGNLLDGPEPIDPSISIAVADSVEANAAVSQLAETGVDFIKTYTLLPRDAFFGAVARARDLGLPVAGHVPAEITVVEAAEAGLRSIEHLRDEIEPFCDPYLETDCTEIFKVFQMHNTYVTPTLSILYNKSHIDQAWIDDLDVREMPATVVSYWTQTRERKLSSEPQSYYREKRLRYEQERVLTGMLSDADIPILAGTDTGDLFVLPGTGLHNELALLVDAGMTSFDALRSATIIPAQFAGLQDSCGSIHPGKTADVILLDGDPIQEIRNAGSIFGVVLRGEWMDSETLSDISSVNR